MSEKITSKDISVVVQGAISEGTKACLESVRKFLPDSDIILSTWEGSDVSVLDYDVLVLSKDPGDAGLIRRFPHIQYNPVNRILVGGKAGVAKATKKYCLKIRTDALLVSADFLKYYNKYASLLTEESVVTQRIMVEGLMTSVDVCYSVSDWWYLGLTTDIALLFDSPLYEKDEIPYFEQKKNKEKAPLGSDVICRYNPEQYVFYQFVKRSTPLNVPFLNFAHFFHNTEDNKEFYHKFLAHNLITMEYTLSGIILPKYQDLNVSSISKYTFTLKKCLDNYSNNSLIRYRKIVLDHLITSSRASVRTRPSNVVENLELNLSWIKRYANLSTIIEFSEKTKVNEESVTFIVSGLVVDEGEFTTLQCVRAIKFYYPNSKILLVTWKNQNTTGISHLCNDILLLKTPQEEPSYGHCEGHPLATKLFTINKQQYMMNTALRQVDTKYAVRIRSDYVVTNRNMIEFYQFYCNAFNKTDEKYRFINNRILTHNFFVQRSDLTEGSFTFSISDCFQLGETEDLLKLWDGHQETFSDLTFFRNGKNKNLNNQDMLGSRYNAEQFFLMSAIKNSLPWIKLPSYYRDNRRNSYIFESQKVIVSNFLIGNSEQIGIKCKFDKFSSDSLYSFSSFFREYLIHIAPNCEKTFERYRQHILEEDTNSISEKKIGFGKKLNTLLKSVVTRNKDALKTVMKFISPSYRVSHGVRERLMEFETEEMHRFHHLNWQHEQTQRKQQELEDQLNTLKKEKDK